MSKNIQKLSYAAANLEAKGQPIKARGKLDIKIIPFQTDSKASILYLRAYRHILIDIIAKIQLWDDPGIIDVVIKGTGPDYL